MARYKFYIVLYCLFQNDECSRRPCLCEYCELIFPAENHAEHVEYCSSRTESCGLCGRFVKLRDRKMHDESNCTLPPSAALPASRSGNDLACDGMEAYHLSHLDHLLCHDIASNAALWMPGQRAEFNCDGQLARASSMPPLLPVGRLNQSRGLYFKRNRPGQFADRREGMPAAASKNNDFSGRRPKVVNARQRGSSTSVHNNDDAGESCCIVPVISA